ncbi:MAG: peptidoglycan DD-metalloendopeptidase family protein [Alphaproteobacteria bacterium]|nr:peptidoglycan DD-metalloendopeptidase family protein [Alphaproteobacteria bacterium]
MVKKIIKNIYPTIKSKRYWVTFCSAFAAALTVILVVFYNTTVNAYISPFTPLDLRDSTDNFEEESTLPNNFDASEIAEAEEPAKDNVYHIEIKKGDTLIKVLTDLGLEYQEADRLFNSIKKVFNPRDLRVGQVLDIETHSSDEGYLKVKSLRSTIRTGEYLEVDLSEDSSYSSKIIKDELTEEMRLVDGTINGSLSSSMNSNGVPSRIVANFINIFSYSVDFRREVKKGDGYEVIYENYLTPDGQFVKSGDIVYAALKLGKNKFELYRFKNSAGNVDYYNEKGLAMKKTLSRRPMAYQSSRISSHFGRRRHPIYKDVRVHWGVDYPAPTGSAIYAAGDGVIEAAQYRSGYGKYIRIRHNSEYSTAYGHLNGYARGIRSGVRVKQGQLIGYVGSTGRSTGPHLHYEIIRNGQRVNPLTVKATASENLSGKNLANFKTAVAKVKDTRNKILAEKNGENKEEQLVQKEVATPATPSEL